jgi:hypothetical protein
MPSHQSTYRGYTIGVERKGSIWFITACPKTPDLPILHCYCSKARLQSEADAIAEAKSRVPVDLLADRGLEKRPQAKDWGSKLIESYAGSNPAK